MAKSKTRKSHHHLFPYVLIFAILFIGVWMITARVPSPSTQVSMVTATPSSTITATYECAGNKSIQATYNNTANSVSLVLSDGRKLTLPQAMSASGARYANANESVVFWNKGNTAFITEGNQTTYSDCETSTN